MLCWRGPVGRKGLNADLPAAHETPVARAFIPGSNLRYSVLSTAMQNKGAERFAVVLLPSPPVLRGRGVGGEGAAPNPTPGPWRFPPHPQPLSPGVPGERGERHSSDPLLWSAVLSTKNEPSRPPGSDLARKSPLQSLRTGSWSLLLPETLESGASFRTESWVFEAIGQLREDGASRRSANLFQDTHGTEFLHHQRR